MSPKWENFKTYLSNTFQELRRVVNNQVDQEIKRGYQAYPKVENPQWEDLQSNSSSKTKARFM